MISSVEKAPRHGRGKLLVDGTDAAFMRKAEAGLSLTGKQQGLLLRLLRLGCETYNASLQERRDAWQMREIRIGAFEQFNQIAELRELGTRADALAFGIQPLRWSIRRVDEAYAGFFARLSAGRASGYPRFKSHRRFDTIGWDEPVGWKLNLDFATLYVQGVGHVKLSRDAIRQYRRLADRGGEPRTLTITRRRNARGGRGSWSWRATVGFRTVAAARTVPTAGNGSVTGLDRGVVVTLADAEGSLLEMPRHLRDLEQQVVELQQSLTGMKKFGRSWKETQHKIRRLRRKAANQTRNWAWHTAKDLVAGHDVLVFEDLNLKGMTKSAKGTVEEPGKNVAAKSGLNKSLQEAALGALVKCVLVKAEEAGRRAWLVPAAYTSQQCSACSMRSPGSRLARDVFYCTGCGHYEHADTNAGRNIRQGGMEAEAAWRAAGSPLLARKPPKFRRRTAGSDEVPAPLVA